jgi:hypothetical protein
MQYLVHGSKDSTDTDIFIILPEERTDADCKKLVSDLSMPEHFDVNFITIKDGIVDWVWHGTPDEANNSLLFTYNFHKQIAPCPVLRKVDRYHSVKVLRFIRSTLSYITRTQHRESAKAALKSTNVKLKLDTLIKVKLSDIQDFGKNRNKSDIYKTIAFQVGQTLALIEDNLELYTKTDIADKYSVLSGYLYRTNDNPHFLDIMLDRLCYRLIRLISNDSDHLMHYESYDRIEVVDISTEKPIQLTII